MSRAFRYRIFPKCNRDMECRACEYNRAPWTGWVEKEIGINIRVCSLHQVVFHYSERSEKQFLASAYKGCIRQMQALYDNRNIHSLEQAILIGKALDEAQRKELDMWERYSDSRSEIQYVRIDEIIIPDDDPLWHHIYLLFERATTLLSYYENKAPEKE